jgi:hypothetical protein
VRELPAGVPDSEADRGIPVGPPPLAALGLPEATEIRLHNELFHRGLLRAEDVKRHPAAVVAAVQAALKVDAGLVMDCYRPRED